MPYTTRVKKWPGQRGWEDASYNLKKALKGRERVQFLRVGFHVSEHRACRVINVRRSVVRYRRVYRWYKLDGLSLRTKPRKWISVQRVPLPPPTVPKEQWSMDFMADQLFNGQRFRVLTLVDNFSKVSPAIEADFSLPGKRVVEIWSG